MVLTKVFSAVKSALPVIVVAVVSTLIALEIVLRLVVVDTWPPAPMTFDHNERNCFRPVPGSSMVYLENGLLGTRTRHEINEAGFRGPMPKPDDDFKIAFVGGSTIFGIGMDENRTLPAVLEQRLENMFPEAGISVLNLGFPGYNILEQSREFQRMADELEPDMVLLAVNDDYSEPSACSGAALPVRNFLRRHVALWNYFEVAIRDARVNVANTFSVPAREHTIDVILKRFVREDRPACLITMITPPPVRRNDESTMSFHDVATRAGFRVINTTGGNAVLSTDGRAHTIVTGPKSLSDGVTQAVAERIAEEIAPEITKILEKSMRQGCHGLP